MKWIIIWSIAGILNAFPAVKLLSHGIWFGWLNMAVAWFCVLVVTILVLKYNKENREERTCHENKN